jgi:splicing factor 1
MERDTGAKIIIRGKGSVKEGKVGRKDGQPLPGEDEPLHAYVTANNPEAVKKAVDRVRMRMVASEIIMLQHIVDI